MSTNEIAIEMKMLTKDYGHIRAVEAVNLQIYRGEIFGYVGPNGAGKTTTIKVLTGLVKPSYGDAVICGYSVQAHPLEVKARIGYIPESGALYDRLSPDELLTSIGKLYRLPDDFIQSEVTRWLSYFGLSEQANRPIGILSKGNKQKILWILAVMHNPDVLILDEPLNGLDAESIVHVKDLMRYMAGQGKTIFYSSHLLDIVEKLCTRIAVLKKGRIVSVGSIESICGTNEAPSLEQALMQLWQ